MVAASLGSMEKETPPVVEVAVTKTSKKHVILTSWASVTTALLLLVLVGGAFYVADLKSMECMETDTSQHDTKDVSRTYDEEGKKVQEDQHMDKDDQTELLIKKDENGNIEMISAEDHKKKILATYVPADDVCLLAAGVDMDWVDEQDDMDTEDSVMNTTSEKVVEEHDYKASRNRVTDLSLLPRAIRSFCEGKDTYWMQPADKEEMEDEMEDEMQYELEAADDTAGRQKRGLICCCVGCWKRKKKCSGWWRKRKCYYYWKFSTSMVGCMFHTTIELCDASECNLACLLNPLICRSCSSTLG